MSGLKVEVYYALALGIVVAALNELITWVLVYRTAQYKRLKSELNKTAQKLEALKAISASDPSKAKKAKKEQRLEENVKTTSRDLNAVRVKCNVIMGVFTLVMWHYVSTTFDGIVMAKLPFTPLGFFTKMTHAGVGGNDFTEAGGTFIYILSMVTCRQVFMQLLGQQPSRAAVRAITAAGTPAWADPKKIK
jgi:hypothetical protein